MPRRRRRRRRRRFRGSNPHPFNLNALVAAGGEDSSEEVYWEDTESEADGIDVFEVDVDE